MFNPEIEPYIDYFLAHIPHMASFFFISSGLWKLLNKEKMLNKTKELCNKIPKEDIYTIDLLKLIDKLVLFFAVFSIIVGICILLRLLGFNYGIRYNPYDWINTLFFMTVALPLLGFALNAVRFGSILFYKRKIEKFYSMQNFQPLLDWEHKEVLWFSFRGDAYLTTDEKCIKHMKREMMSFIIIGKFMFYSGLISWCFLL
ncbi:MAG: hypothetical protein J6W29_10395 [Neisseriaceae bacterium]|nr:hypothetical protein [Neisseriaceae bacterium]